MWHPDLARRVRASFGWLPEHVVITNNNGKFALTAILILNHSVPIMVMTNQHASRSKTVFGSPIRGKTLPAIGVGHIGSEAARQTERIGLTVLGVRRPVKPHRQVYEMCRPAEFDRVPPRGDFVLVPANPGFTIALTEDGHPVTSIRPGTYWLAVTDNCKNHNFELRSCPGSDSPCDPNSDGVEQEITPMNDPNTANGATGTVMVKIHLVHGTYRLFCDAPVTGHPGQTHETFFNMYTDFAVGGVGQVG